MTTIKFWMLALGLVLLLGPQRASRGAEHGFLSRVFKDPDGKGAKYVLFIPHGYKGDEPYPLILFLHGLGESGSDGRMQAQVGLGPVIKRQEKKFPFIAVFPQSQKKSWQAANPDAQRALSILAEVEKEYRVDPKRIYLTGLSMGGFGTWSLAAAHPDRWAAIAPICGGGNPKNAEKIKDIPCWCFHGAADKTVSAENSRTMINAIKAAGGHPKYTEYPGVGHNSWDKAYATPELYQWFLEQKLK